MGSSTAPRASNRGGSALPIHQTPSAKTQAESYLAEERENKQRGDCQAPKAGCFAHKEAVLFAKLVPLQPPLKTWARSLPADQQNAAPRGTEEKGRKWSDSSRFSSRLPAGRRLHKPRVAFLPSRLLRFTCGPAPPSLSLPYPPLLTESSRTDRSGEVRLPHPIPSPAALREAAGRERKSSRDPGRAPEPSGMVNPRPRTGKAPAPGERGGVRVCGEGPVPVPRSPGT